ncbi:MAG TPA: RDD family protein [Blastocatellia bacterium]|nr:RDD family protein [Blastocatellia bacterium]
MSSNVLDDELVVETPERVELRFVLASIGNRFIAAAIDHLIQAVLIVGLILLVFLGLSDSINSKLSAEGSWAGVLLFFGLFLIYWGYFVLFETIWSGQTPGKRIMHLRVVREDGRPVRFFEVFVRNVLRLLIDFQPVPSYAVGVVSIIFSPLSKRVGDYVAGTVVIKERSTEAPSLDEVIKVAELEQRRLAPLATQPFKTDARRLSTEDVKAVDAFLKRRYELPDEKRSVLAARIARSVAFRLNIPDSSLSPETFLEEIDRQHRYQTRYSD